MTMDVVIDEARGSEVAGGLTAIQVGFGFLVGFLERAFRKDHPHVRLGIVVVLHVAIGACVHPISCRPGIRHILRVDFRDQGTRPLPSWRC